VIWTDEASFRYGYFGQVYVTRKAREEFDSDRLFARFRKYSACMVWGAITALVPKELVVFEEGRVDGYVYRTQILPQLGRIEQMYSHESLFNHKSLVVQDNAPIHKAGLTMVVFECSGVDLIPWPANSPDLNPIENIWAILKGRVSKHVPVKREAVIQAIRIEWSRLTASNCARACQSMKARCQAVIEAEGGHTKW
jgi:transposase